MSSRAFTRQLMSLQSNMLSFAYMLTSDRKSAHALVQDATLCALDREQNYNEAMSFKSWVFGMMRNIFATEYKAATHSADNYDSLYTLSLDIAGEYPEGTYDVAQLSDAIAAMDKDVSVSFTMHVTGYDDNEIADILCMPGHVLRSCLNTARKAIRALIN